MVQVVPDQILAAIFNPNGTVRPVPDARIGMQALGLNGRAIEAIEGQLMYYGPAIRNGVPEPLTIADLLSPPMDNGHAFRTSVSERISRLAADRPELMAGADTDEPAPAN